MKALTVRSKWIKRSFSVLILFLIVIAYTTKRVNNRKVKHHLLFWGFDFEARALCIYIFLPG